MSLELDHEIKNRRQALATASGTQRKVCRDYSTTNALAGGGPGPAAAAGPGITAEKKCVAKNDPNRLAWPAGFRIMVCGETDMNPVISFDGVLDAIEHLPADQQAELIEVMRRRLAERARQRIVEDAREARAEHAAGKTRAVSVDDLLREIES